MMTEEMYDRICKPEFENLNAGQDVLAENMKKNHAEVMDVLKGSDEKPGLCERVRVLEKAYGKLMAGGIFVLCAVGLQLIDATFNFIKRLFK